jgi:hypothetical protein
MSLMQIQMQQDQQLSESIGNFVSSFANMGKATQAYQLTPVPAGG